MGERRALDGSIRRLARVAGKVSDRAAGIRWQMWKPRRRWAAVLLWLSLGANAAWFALFLSLMVRNLAKADTGGTNADLSGWPLFALASSSIAAWLGTPFLVRRHRRWWLRHLATELVWETESLRQRVADLAPEHRWFHRWRRRLAQALGVLATSSVSVGPPQGPAVGQRRVGGLCPCVERREP